MEGLIAIHSHATQKNIGDTEEKISLHIIHALHRRRKLFRKLCWMTISGLTKIIRHIGNAFLMRSRKISNQRNMDRKITAPNERRNIDIMEVIMNIKDIKIRKLYNEDRLRALVSISDEEMAIHDIKIIEGPQRLFVAMPSRRDDHGIFRDIVHPITSEARQALEEKILAAYEQELERRNNLPAESNDIAASTEDHCDGNYMNKPLTDEKDEE